MYKTVTLKPCRTFNSREFQFEGHHTFNGVTYKKNCNFCYKQGKKFNHAEVNCNNKLSDNNTESQTDNKWLTQAGKYAIVNATAFSNINYNNSVNSSVIVENNSSCNDSS